MKTVALTPRQQAIADLLPRCECVADIGCDHGKLGAYLLQTGRARRVIATDISEPSLHKAEKLAEELGLSAGFSFRAGSGLSVLNPGEAQAIVIGGMGAYTIAEILRGADAFEKEIFVLQPMGHEIALRRMLAENGFGLTDDRVVREGRRFYQVLQARRGACTQDLQETLLPIHSVRRGDAEALAFAQKRVKELEKWQAYGPDEQKSAEYRALRAVLEKGKR